MTEKRNNASNVPTLRFPGFSDDWNSVRLGNTCEINPKSESLPNSFVYIDLESVSSGVLLKEEVVFKSNAPSRAQRLLKKGDVLFQMVRPYQKNNLFFNLEGDYVGSTGYAQLRTKFSSEFLFQYLQTQKFVDKVIERCTGTSYPAINSTDLSNIGISLPSLEEQKKIATFLSLIDARIQTQNKIIENLESLIKSLEVKFFNQEQKFKNSYGKSFSDWQPKKLGEIGQTYNGLSGKTKEDFGTGKSYIQYKQIFDSSKIQIEGCGLVNVLVDESQNTVKYGDVFFTVSSETPDEIGMSSVLLNEVDEMYLNSFCFGYRPNSLNIINPKYARYYFRCKEFRGKIVKLAQGSTRYNMSKSELMKLEIQLPSLDEQIRISESLAAIDDKIQIENDVLKKYVLQKRYVLKNLFI